MKRRRTPRFTPELHLTNVLFYAATSADVEAFMREAEKPIEPNWEVVFRGACKGGCQAIIEYVIGKGATNWQAGLEEALPGKVYVANDMIRRGAVYDGKCRNYNAYLAIIKCVRGLPILCEDVLEEIVRRL